MSAICLFPERVPEGSLPTPSVGACLCTSLCALRDHVLPLRAGWEMMGVSRGALQEAGCLWASVCRDATEASWGFATWSPKRPPVTNEHGLRHQETRVQILAQPAGDLGQLHVPQQVSVFSSAKQGFQLRVQQAGQMPIWSMRAGPLLQHRLSLGLNPPPRLPSLFSSGRPP